MAPIRYQLRFEETPILTLYLSDEDFFTKEFVEPSKYKMVKQVLVEIPRPHWEDVEERKLTRSWDW